MTNMNEVFAKYKIENDIKLMEQFLTETICRPYDIAEYLRDWYEAKSEYLFDLFGDELIIDCGEIEFNQNNDVILDMMFNDLKLDKIRNDFYNIMDSLIKELFYDKTKKDWPTNPYGCEDLETASYVEQLLNFRSLHILLNRGFAISKEKATFTAVDGHKEYVYIHKGQRVSKIWNNFFKTIEKVYPTQYTKKIEKARYLSQQLLANIAMYAGKKKTTGRLKLSIHPFDYITMSQNNCDWYTCMSFEDREGMNGDYCAGTVAMMNSKNTIVAYLEADTPYYPCYVGSYRNTTWNNKKYRNLIIVDPLIISTVKGYPAIIDSVDEIILNKIKDLCAERLNWAFDKSSQKYSNIRKAFNDIYISLNTHKMYNDTQHVALYMVGKASNLDITPTTADWNKSYHKPYWDLTYDGKVKCLDCGRDIEDSDYPLCFHCRGFERCEECGAWINLDDGDCDFVLKDGTIYCFECYVHQEEDLVE